MRQPVHPAAQAKIDRAAAVWRDRLDRELLNLEDPTVRRCLLLLAERLREFAGEGEQQVRLSAAGLDQLLEGR